MWLLHMFTPFEAGVCFGPFFFCFFWANLPTSVGVGYARWLRVGSGKTFTITGGAKPLWKLWRYGCGRGTGLCKHKLNSTCYEFFCLFFDNRFF